MAGDRVASPPLRHERRDGLDLRAAFSDHKVDTYCPANGAAAMSVPPIPTLHDATVEDQTAAIALLGDPATHGGAVVERIETHASVVFLAGERVYKLKRAVRYPYLDYGTVARRRQACRDEVRLNRRTAPALYLGVAPIVRHKGGLALGALGDEPTDAIDWVVVMRRFDQATLFDRLASAGRLDIAMVERAAAAVARFHRDAERHTDVAVTAVLAWVIDDNERGLADAGVVAARCRAWLGRLGPLLDGRARAGFVRACHGDLHLRNICMVDGAPTLFDGIEFDPRFSVIDVGYDIAFLLMDLLHRDLAVHAAAALARWIAETDDLEALAALPLFLGLRAMVRAKVEAAAARLPGHARAEPAAYLALAARALDPAPPCLVAIGGLSGTGKSTLARALAPGLGPDPGALVLRSDVMRKRLAGVAVEQRLPPGAYTTDATERVYDRLRTDAARALAAGHAVIVDAVHARPEERTGLEAVAAAAGVPFVGLWLDAPTTVLETRVAARAGDASDADVGVVQAQASYDLGVMDWTRVIAGGDGAATLAAARDALASLGHARVGFGP
jgi:aminoglycoside phosphotransferase family enzyme/predicted kinase